MSRIETIASGSVDEEKVGTLDLTDAEKNKYRLESGDILFSHINSPAHVGKTALFDGASELYHGMNLMLLRTIPAVDAKYLENYLQSLRSRGYWARTAKQSVNQASVNQRDIRKVAIPLPPLEEQRRIVAVLDEAFEGLARARENTEANLASARELFEAAVESALLEAGGHSMTLQELLDDGSIVSHLDGNHGSSYPKKTEFVEDGVPYISANCITDQQVDMARCKYLTPERAATLKKGVARDRDVIFAHNATVGPVALLRTHEPKVILSTSLTYYRCDEEKIRPEFLVCEMRSAGFRRQYEAVMAQATRNQVPITTQRKFEHIVPSMAGQLKIAGLGVELEEIMKRLNLEYLTTLRDLEDLRQSLLQKAFAGELT